MDNTPAKNINKQIKIIALNINSLISNQKRANLLQLTKKLNPDIILLGETKLNSRHKISYTQFTIHRTDRKNVIQGGGTAILIKNTIDHKVIHLTDCENNKVIEATAIKIDLPNHEKLIIISIYAPGNNKMEFLQELDNLFV